MRLGKKTASRALVLLPLVAFLYLGALPLVTTVAPSVWLGFIGLPLAMAACVRLWRRYDVTADIVPAQAWTLASFVLLAVGSGIGLLL